jgi:hypothetical protein
MAASKNNITVGIIRGNDIGNTTKPDVDLFKRQVAKGEIVEQSVNPALLISTLDYPINIAYNDGFIRLSPRAKIKVGDVNKLQKELPARVFLKKITSLK